jgi:hypothetical protein
LQDPGAASFRIPGDTVRQQCVYLDRGANLVRDIVFDEGLRDPDRIDDPLLPVERGKSRVGLERIIRGHPARLWVQPAELHDLLGSPHGCGDFHHVDAAEAIHHHRTQHPGSAHD